VKKQKGKELFVRFRPVLFSFAVPFVFLGMIMLFLFLKNGIAVIGGDCTGQMIPFMTEFRRKILSGENLFYSWSGGGGYDFWAVYCYYLSSPFTWLSLLVKEESLPLFVNFLVLLKISLCGAGFSYYAVRKNLCKTEAQTVLFSALYALCGYTAAYSIDIMWMEAVALFPLLMLGMDRLVYDKKPALYTLTLALIFMCNYYLGFTVAVGVFFYYFTFRFDSVRDFFAKSVRILGFSLLSAANCAVFLFPSFLVAMEAGRADEEARFGFLDNFWDSVRNLLFFDPPATASESASVANIYVTVFALFFVFLWFFASKAPKREKIRNGIIVAFLFLSFNIGTLNMIWHGFRMPILVQNRFSFMLCFILLVMAAKAFSEKEKLDRTMAAWGSAAFLLFAVILCFANTENKIRIVFSLLAAVAYIFVFFKIKKQRLQFAVYSVCAAVGVSVCFLLAVQNGTGEYSDSVYNPAIAEAVSETQTDDFCREKNLCIDENAPSINSSILYGLRGFPIFSSYINAKQTTQYIRFGLVNFLWDSYAIQHFDGQNLGNYNLPNSVNVVADSLSGVKHIYAYKDMAVNSDLLRLAYEKDNIVVYENNYALPVGFQLKNKTITDIGNTSLLPHSVYNSIGKSLDCALYRSCTLTLDVTENTLFEKSQYATYTFYSDNEEPVNATFRYRVKEDNTPLVLYYGGMTKMNVTVRCNGEEIYSCKQFFSDFPELGTFKKGDQIEINISSINVTSLSVELMIFDEDAFVRMQQQLNEAALQVTESADDRIIGTVSAKEDHVLFTSIPYSKNWKAFTDGEETQVTSLSDGFLIIPLTAGEHTIELQYTPPLFRECLCISIFGILLSFVTFFVYHKKIKSNKSRKDDSI